MILDYHYYQQSSNYSHHYFYLFFYKLQMRRHLSKSGICYNSDYNVLIPFLLSIQVLEASSSHIQLSNMLKYAASYSISMPIGIDPSSPNIRFPVHTHAYHSHENIDTSCNILCIFSCPQFFLHLYKTTIQHCSKTLICFAKLDA